MATKRLSQQPLTSVIKDDDSIIGVFEGKLGLANVANWLSKINASFDINVDSDTDEEYVLSITVGRKTVTTPNLKAVSILNARIELGHLYFDMSDGRTIDAGVVNSDAKKYGVCYDFKSKNPKLTRLGDAKYLKAGVANGVDDTNVVNDFDKIYPWSDIKRCTVADDGTITSYEGDPNYTENGSIGEVLTEIPEHYRMTYISEATGKMYHYVSREKLNEHYKFVPKTYIGSFLMSDSNEDGIGESRAGDYYSEPYAYKDVRPVATSRGAGWHMMDIWDYETVKILFMIEFATTDSQSLFMGNEISGANNSIAYANELCMKDYLLEEGQIADTEQFEITSIVSDYPDFFVGDEIEMLILSNSNPDELDYSYGEENYAVRKIIAAEPIDITAYPDFPDAMRYYFSGNPVTVGKAFDCYLVSSRNGLTNDIKASSGKLLRYENGDGEPPSEGSMVWRGIENLVGEGYTWLDGILLHNGKYWVCNDVSKYDNTIYVRDADGNATEEYQYQPVSFDIPTRGYITKMEYDESTGLTLPIETGGTSDTGYCDNFYTPTSKASICSARYGGTSTPAGGLFNFYGTLPAGNSTQKFFARLSYHHS